MPTDDDAQDPANELRVIVVVLSLEREPWETLEAAQRETWAQEREGVEIFYLQGVARGPLRMALLAVRKLAERLQLLSPFDRVVGRAFAQLPVGMHGNTIRTSTVEYWIGTSAKTHACLKYLARRDSFDYLVRTNSSTYVHLPRLLNHLAGAPRKGYYAGADQGEPHAQGTLIILSSDVVERLANDRHWEYDTVDDAALGRAALRGGYPLQPLHQVVLHEAGGGLPDAIPAMWDAANFIFRFKNRADRQADAQRLRALHIGFGESDSV